MACHSCKSSNTRPVIDGKDGTNIFTRLIYFIIGVCIILILAPIVVIVGIYMLFNTTILDKSTEILPSITFLGNMLTKKKDIGDDESTDIEDEFNPEDYELVGVEEIKK